MKLMKSYKTITSEKQIRKCLVTGVRTTKQHLMRFVVDPENQLVADINQNLPGRGYWIKAERHVIDTAIKKNLFLKSIKAKVKIDLNLIPMIEQQLIKQMIQQIALSRKAGQAIFGFEKIKSYILNNNITLLIQALDGSIKEKERLVNKSIPSFIDNCLTSFELGQPFGKNKVVHCAILGDGFVENIIFIANRLNNLKNPLPHYNDTKLPERS